MIRDAFIKCGSIALPLLIVSILIYSFIFAKIIALVFSRKDTKRIFGHNQLIDPLASFAVSLGFLGTVTGFIKAFYSFVQVGFNSEALMKGIPEALYTTLVGLILSLSAGFSCYIFDVLENKRKLPEVNIADNVDTQEKERA